MSGKRLVFRMYKALSKFNILKKSNFAIEKKKMHTHFTKENIQTENKINIISHWENKN